MSLPPLLLTFTDPISDALLSTHQPQALHFYTGPQTKNPASLNPAAIWVHSSPPPRLAL